jgi:hypothetical protein
MRSIHNAVMVAGTLFVLGCGPSSSRDPGGGGVDGGGNGPGGCQGAACMNHCPGGTMTTISGVVKAPNGIDPVPGALVYLPREVTEFPAEVRCEVCSQLTDNAVVAAATDYDGSFTLGPIPTADNQQPGLPVQVVAQKGRFRRLENVTINNVCADNQAQLQLPGRNDGFNTIPKIAVATGDYDKMECVLLKLGLEQGHFDLFDGIETFPPFVNGDPMAVGNLGQLIQDLPRMKQYNIIFLNCANDTYEQLLTNPTVRANIHDYVQAGGRLYVTDWSYDYVEQIPEFAPMIDFGPSASGDAPEPMNAAAIGSGGITTDALVLDDGLRLWLEAVERVTGQNLISAASRVHIQHFLGGWVMQREVPARPESKVWLNGPVTGDGLSGDLPLTTTFDYAQCGRVLYSSYHTLGRDDGGLTGFPAYCDSGPLSPQERVLLYLIMHVADCITID